MGFPDVVFLQDDFCLFLLQIVMVFMVFWVSHALELWFSFIKGIHPIRRMLQQIVFLVGVNFCGVNKTVSKIEAVTNVLNLVISTITEGGKIYLMLVTVLL